MQGPRFDWSINLGHVLTILAVLGVMFTTYTTYRETITDHELRLKSIERQTSVMVQQSTEAYVSLYSIKQDVAVIKDRLERQGITRQNFTTVPEELRVR